jgi:hypothetical protein
MEGAGRWLEVSRDSRGLKKEERGFSRRRTSGRERANEGKRTGTIL